MNIPEFPLASFVLRVWSGLQPLNSIAVSALTWPGLVLTSSLGAASSSCSTPSKCPASAEEELVERCLARNWQIQLKCVTSTENKSYCEAVAAFLKILGVNQACLHRFFLCFWWGYVWGKSSPQLWRSESQLTAAVLDKRQKAAWKEATWEVSFWTSFEILPPTASLFLADLRHFQKMRMVVAWFSYATCARCWVASIRVRLWMSHLALESGFDRVESSEVMRFKRWLRLVASAAWLKRIETSSQESQDPNKRHWTLIVIFLKCCFSLLLPGSMWCLVMGCLMDFFTSS